MQNAFALYLRVEGSISFSSYMQQIESLSPVRIAVILCAFQTKVLGPKGTSPRTMDHRGMQQKWSKCLTLTHLTIFHLE